MSRVDMRRVAAVVALAYMAANAVDAALTDLDRLPGLIDTAAFVLVYPLSFAFLLLLVGGLPLAIFGLLVEHQWEGVPVERRRNPRAPYWCLPFQIVSCGVSALVLAVLVLEFLLSGQAVPPDLPFVAFAGYGSSQLILGIAAIPVWRRQVMNGAPTRRFITGGSPLP